MDYDRSYFPCVPIEYYGVFVNLYSQLSRLRQHYKINLKRHIIMFKINITHTNTKKTKLLLKQDDNSNERGRT